MRRFTATFKGTRFASRTSRRAAGAPAIGVNDPGFAALLRDTGALLTWKPGERYVLITTAVPVVVSFAVGDRRYDVGPIALQASFAPYLRGDEAYLPFRRSAARARSSAARKTAALRFCSRSSRRSTCVKRALAVTLFAHAGAPLRARVVQESATCGDLRIRRRRHHAGRRAPGRRRRRAQRSNCQLGNGSRSPMTLVTVRSSPERSPRRRRIPTAATSLQQCRRQPRSTQQQRKRRRLPSRRRTATSQAARRTRRQRSGARYRRDRRHRRPTALRSRLRVTGNADLRVAPPARARQSLLDRHQERATAGAADRSNAAESARFDARAPVDPTTVRVALSLDGPKSIDVHAVGDRPCDRDRPRRRRRRAAHRQRERRQRRCGRADGPRSRRAERSEPGDRQPTIRLGSSARAAVTLPTNPRLIVIDPGHGGSDVGTEHGGLTEARPDARHGQAAARRFLFARGWEVQLTRDTRRRRLCSPTIARTTNFKRATTSPTMPVRGSS